jgi:DNA excision repair protein ERCC-4
MMEIIVDTREQLPWEFKGFNSIKRGLKTGDYSVRFLDVDYDNEIILERKSLDDFVGVTAQGRERFERELVRSMEIPHFFIIIEGSWEQIEKHAYHSQINPNSVIGSILSWQIKYGCNIILAGDRTRAKRLALKIFEAFLRNKTKKKKEKVGIAPLENEIKAEII